MITVVWFAPTAATKAKNTSIAATVHATPSAVSTRTAERSGTRAGAVATAAGTSSVVISGAEVTTPRAGR